MVACQSGRVQFVVAGGVERHELMAKLIVKGVKSMLLNMQMTLVIIRVNENQHPIDPVQRSAGHQTDVALGIADGGQLLDVAFTQLASRGQLRAGQIGHFVEARTRSNRCRPRVWTGQCQGIDVQAIDADFKMQMRAGSPAR